MKTTRRISFTMLLGFGLMVLSASFLDAQAGNNQWLENHKRSSD